MFPYYARSGRSRPHDNYFIDEKYAVSGEKSYLSIIGTNNLSLQIMILIKYSIGLLLIGLLTHSLFFPLRAQEVTLLFAGDAMQHQSQIDHAFRDGRYDYSSYFQYLKEEITSADLAIVNLEVTLAGKPYKGYPQFSAPDEYAWALKEAGFDIFLNANNHIVDRGNAGVLRTLSTLDSRAILHTGVFKNAMEKEQNYPLIVEKKGICFAFLNYTYATNGFYASPPVIVNYIRKDSIRKDIQKAKRLGADVIIAHMHWGVEYKMIQNKAQEDLAKFMIREGVDLIIGAHPHVIQPSKVVTDSLGNIDQVIVYSLGNLISGMIAPNTDGGQLLKVTLRRSLDKVRIQSAEYALIYRHKEKEGTKINYTVVPVALVGENDSSPDNTIIPLNATDYRKMKTFAGNARAVLLKYNEGVPEYKPLFRQP
jgi:poly-gamma-glutamate synthesis protein (capsule biosynthesis protein)